MRKGENLTAYSYIFLDPSWQTVPALMQKQVYQIPAKPFSWFDRPPGANRMIGIVWIAHLLYPDQFPYDMVHVTREFFRAFYEADISEVQAQALLTTRLPPHSAAKNFSPGKL
jgi:iron complex transport system substrate-binding protein